MTNGATTKNLDNSTFERQRRWRRSLGERRPVFVLFLAFLTAAVGPNLMSLGMTDLFDVGRVVAARWCLVLGLLWPIGLVYCIYDCRLRTSRASKATASSPKLDLFSQIGLAIAALTLALIVTWVLVWAPHNGMYYGAWEIAIGELIFLVAASSAVVFGTDLLRASVIQKIASAVRPRRAMVTFLSNQVAKERATTDVRSDVFAATSMVIERMLALARASAEKEGAKDGQQETLQDLEIRQAVLMTLFGPDGQTPAVTPSELLDGICNRDLRPLKWQQNLRALLRHFSKGASPAGGVQNRQDEFVLYVVTSKESQREAIVFEEAVRRLWNALELNNDHLKILTHGPIGFEELPQVNSALETAIFTLRSTPYELDYGDITIDATAGQKTVSIAAAAITFQSDLEFSYVDTNAPYDVHVVDMRVALNPQA